MSSLVRLGKVEGLAVLAPFEAPTQPDALGRALALLSSTDRWLTASSA